LAHSGRLDFAFGAIVTVHRMAGRLHVDESEFCDHWHPVIWRRAARFSSSRAPGGEARQND
jgi:hypothetical protein